jgi:hypothetical protein
MRLLVYRTVTGIPQRVLSVSQRVQGPGGEFHEGDDAVPRQFIEAAYILSESQRPSPFVLSETDLTPEVIAEKAKKYDILPEVRVLPDFDFKQILGLRSNVSYLRRRVWRRLPNRRRGGLPQQRLLLRVGHHETQAKLW